MARDDKKISVSPLISILQLVLGKTAPLSLSQSASLSLNPKGKAEQRRELEGMPENIFIFTTLMESAQTSLVELEESAACLITTNILKDHCIL